MRTIYAAIEYTARWTERVPGEAPRFAAAIGLDEQGEPATIASLWRQDRG
jgi:hypothetical protein